MGSATQTVEVTAAAPLLQTETPTIGAKLNSGADVAIALGGQRTFTYLARLSPGVLPAEQGARDSLGGGFSANGVRSTGENNFLLNGVDNNVNVIDFINQTSFVIGPSVEAIGEMTVITNGNSAEYGRAAGGVVNVNLKSGTNELHGVVFEILQNDKLNANRWENNQSRGESAAAQAEPVRRGGRRADHQEQTVYFWRLSRDSHRDSRRSHSKSRLWRPDHYSNACDDRRRLLLAAGTRRSQPTLQSHHHHVHQRLQPGTLKLSRDKPQFTREAVRQ